MFTGREYFFELGIYDFRHRFYYPALGSFLQPDPLGFGGGDANLFRYCGGDPVNRKDPSGLDWYPGSFGLLRYFGPAGIATGVGVILGTLAMDLVMLHESNALQMSTPVHNPATYGGYPPYQSEIPQISAVPSRAQEGVEATENRMEDTGEKASFI